jgi:hypothetical protein
MGFFDDVVSDWPAANWHGCVDCLVGQSLQKVTSFEREENEKR